MTALIAGYLVNGPFKNSTQSAIVNGIKPRENGDSHKLEFVEGGILKPPQLPSNVIRLKPDSVSHQTPTKSAPFIGPVIPTSLNLSSISTSSSSTKVNGIAAATTPTTARGIKRKRVLSDRFETESQYPVIEPTVALLTSWDGCGRVSRCGALAGIRNPHNNCFLNSVLQAVCHIPQFARFIIENHIKGGAKCPNYQCILCSLQKHIQQGLNQFTNDALWFNRYFEDIFPNHIRGTQEDAHELLLFLLDAIDRQQQKIRRSLPGKISSIIEQVFDGKIRCEFTCTVCQKGSIRYEPTRGLSVDLPRHNSNDPNHSTTSRIVRDFFAEEKIYGYDCKNCKRKQLASKRTKIVTAPNVMIIQVKRFLRYTKINDSVFVCKTIDLSDLMHNSDNACYNLLGFIKHIGGSMSSGHYTATFTGFDGKIYHFDDETRIQSNINFQKPMQPYILFYSKQQYKKNYS